jgi:hypothetical protein
MDCVHIETANWTSSFGKSGSKKENCGNSTQGSLENHRQSCRGRPIVCNRDSYIDVEELTKRALVQQKILTAGYSDVLQTRSSHVESPGGNCALC